MSKRKGTNYQVRNATEIKLEKYIDQNLTKLSSNIFRDFFFELTQSHSPS